MPPMVARLAVEMSGAKRRPCGFSCAFSSSSTMPGSTRAQRSATFSSSMRLRYFEVSTMRPSPIAWPACDVPPPRIVIGQRMRGADADDADAGRRACAGRRRRAARSGRRWRRWSRGRARPRRSGPRLRSSSRYVRASTALERRPGRCDRHVGHQRCARPSRSRSQPRGQRLAAAGERDAQRALAARPVGGAVDDRRRRLVQQAAADLVRRRCRARGRRPWRRSRLRAAARATPGMPPARRCTWCAPARRTRRASRRRSPADRSAPRRPRPGRRSPGRGSTAAAPGTSPG